MNCGKGGRLSECQWLNRVVPIFIGCLCLVRERKQLRNLSFFSPNICPYIYIYCVCGLIKCNLRLENKFIWTNEAWRANCYTDETESGLLKTIRFGGRHGNACILMDWHCCERAPTPGWFFIYHMEHGITNGNWVQSRRLPYYIVVSCLTISLFAFVAVVVKPMQFTCALSSVIIHPTLWQCGSSLSFALSRHSASLSIESLWQHVPKRLLLHPNRRHPGTDFAPSARHLPLATILNALISTHFHTVFALDLLDFNYIYIYWTTHGAHLVLGLLVANWN